MSFHLGDEWTDEDRNASLNLIEATALSTLGRQTTRWKN